MLFTGLQKPQAVKTAAEVAFDQAAIEEGEAIERGDGQAIKEAREKRQKAAAAVVAERTR